MKGEQVLEPINIARVMPRIGAAFIDILLVAIITTVIMFFWGVVIGLNGSESNYSQEYIEELWKGRGFLVGLLVDFAYTTFLMQSQMQATLGMRALSLNIIKENGDTVKFGAAVLRYLISIISSILLKLGYLFAIFSSKNQTLHDLIAGTIVIDKKNSYSDTASIKNNIGLDEKINSSLTFKVGSKSITSIDEEPFESESEYWETASNELKSNNINESLWAKLFSETDGDENKTKARYLKHRVDELKFNSKKFKTIQSESTIKANLSKLIINIEKNTPEENFNTGMSIYNGASDFPANHTKAFNFLYHAAVNGHFEAQFNLSLMYWKGDGVTKDKAKAYAWCRIASRNVLDASDNVKYFSKNITKSEIVESDKLVKIYSKQIEDNQPYIAPFL